MFVSRTVAAEVLMEAEANSTAYAVLRALDQEGGLRFLLPYVSRSPLCDIADFGCTSSLVEDLIKVASFRTMSPKALLRHSFASCVSRPAQSLCPRRGQLFGTYGEIFQARTLPLVLSYF